MNGKTLACEGEKDREGVAERRVSSRNLHMQSCLSQSSTGSMSLSVNLLLEPKLFSNGMRQSKQRHVTLWIKASDSFKWYDRVRAGTCEPADEHLWSNGNRSPGSLEGNNRKMKHRPYQSKTFKVDISYASKIPMQAIANALRDQGSENSQFHHLETARACLGLIRD